MNIPHFTKPFKVIFKPFCVGFSVDCGKGFGAEALYTDFKLNESLGEVFLKLEILVSKQITRNFKMKADALGDFFAVIFHYKLPDFKGSLAVCVKGAVYEFYDFATRICKG